VTVLLEYLDFHANVESCIWDMTCIDNWHKSVLIESAHRLPEGKTKLMLPIY